MIFAAGILVANPAVAQTPAILSIDGKIFVGQWCPGKNISNTLVVIDAGSLRTEDTADKIPEMVRPVRKASVDQVQAMLRYCNSLPPKK